MRYAAMLLAVCCLLSVEHAQWLETTIQLDSGATPMALCYNSVNDKVYCANKDADNVTVIDAATNGVITTVAVGEHPYSICYNPLLNKVYCSGSTGSFIAVIDGSTDSVVARIDDAGGLYVVYYDPQNNKVYGGRDAPNVDVVDCEGDSVLATVPAWGSPLAFCSNPHNKKVYYAAHFGDHVGVIDGATDSLLAEIPLAPGSDPRALCYDPTDNKIYCSANNGHTVAVIDGDSDSIVAEVNVGHTSALCYSQSGNKVYVTQNYGGVSVIDCATDSVVATVPSQQGSEAILFNAKSNKVFSAGLTEVTVIDAASDTVLRTIEVGGYPADMCCSPAYNRVYVASAYNSTIAVLADSVSGIEEGPEPPAPSHKLEPTVLSGASGAKRLASSVLFDAMGRRVAEPKPGVYFVREAQAQAQAITKVVIQH